MTDKRKSFDWILLAIIALAAVLRIFRIASESLWFDESAVLVRIESSYWGLFTDWHSHRQGWLHPFLLKLWFGVFGSSETALRLPSSIFGVLCVWAIYVTGKKMFGRTAGLAAALFMAVSPFAIQHSQEARPYTLYLLGGILSIYSLVLLLERYSRGRAAFYVISTLVALFSHPLAILLFPAHVAGYFVFRQYPEYPAIRQNTRLLIRTLLLTVILSLPQTGRSLILFVLKARGGDI
ncbi:glycosyltransferase family 39 protein, partial [bacterium]|nr:glycosyltransferase family 39 protein [bacterium]